MANIVVALILVLLVGASILCIIRSKKKGVTCIGCPDAGICAAAKQAASGSCGGSCAGCKGCTGHMQA